MKQAIILEGIRYPFQHIALYCPIVSEKKDRKYGLSLVIVGLDGNKIQVLFDSKEERDEKLYELDVWFGLENAPERKVVNPNDFLKREAQNSGYLIDSIT